MPKKIPGDDSDKKKPEMNDVREPKAKGKPDQHSDEWKAENTRQFVRLAESDFAALDFISQKLVEEWTMDFSRANTLRYCVKQQIQRDTTERSERQAASYAKHAEKIKEGCVNFKQVPLGADLGLKTWVYWRKADDKEMIAKIMSRWSMRKFSEAVRFAIRMQAVEMGFETPKSGW